MRATAKSAAAAAAVFASAWLSLAGCATHSGVPASVRLERTAEAHYRAGKLGAAQAAYKRLLEITPNRPSAYLRLGAIAYQQGNSVEAKQHFETALRTDPKNSQATYNLAMLNLNDASRLLKAYLALAPTGAARERVSRMLDSLEQFEARQ